MHERPNNAPFKMQRNDDDTVTLCFVFMFCMHLKIKLAGQGPFYFTFNAIANLIRRMTVTWQKLLLQ